VKIIAINDEPIATIVEARELPAGEVGEIIVRGPIVTQVYDAAPEATLFAKIPDSSNSRSGASASAALWHRMGDCGYRDGDGRLWFCGRKVERVVTPSGTLHTEPCEQVFRRHPRAARCALIGLGEHGEQRPALVVETRIADSSDGRALARELRAMAGEHSHTAEITLFYFRERFPVDVRHNAKIHRHTLARWARTARSFESEPKR
jgi:acyl-CoA synthetase (AMP-forming)/AMP-acid ligase II